MDLFLEGSHSVFPLSLSQQNIWSLEQACPGTPINNISTTLRICGRVDLSALQKSVELVLSADASLRTRIILRDRLPMQYHGEFVKEIFPVYHFSQTSPESVAEWEMAVTRETIPLLDAPLYRFILFRTGENEGGLLMKLHHMISDGWTQILLCNRIGQTYLDLLAGRQPQLDPAPSYELHVKEETEYISSRAYGRDEAYWVSMLSQSGEPSMLKSVKGAAVSPVGRRRSFALPQELNHKIYTFCVENRVAPFSVLYLALGIYFKRIGGADRFTIGVPIFNRTSYEFKQTSGMFVNTVPFFNELRGEWSLSECCAHLTEQWLEMLRHQRMPFPHIQRLMERAGNRDGRLFQIALSYQNGQMLSSKDASVTFTGRWHYSGYQMEQLCIHLSNLEDGRRYAIDYDYLAQLFSEQEIKELHNCLINILWEGLSAPDKPVCSLTILDAREREKVLYTFNRTQTPVYDDALYARFAGTVARYPERVALICAGARVTYAQADRAAAGIQGALSAVAQGPALAAVLLPRTPALLTALMGALRAGWAFVVLSPSLPANRAREILRQSGAAALITRESVLQGSGLTEAGLPVVDVDRLPEGVYPPAAAAADTLAYVVYTSGSTGTPKGVEISQGNLLNLAAAMAPVYGKGAVLSMCSVGFDAFLLESVVALLNAQTVVLPEDADLESPRRLAELMKGYGVGFLATTPSRLTALMKHPDFCAAVRRLESVVCGGEAFPGDLLHRLQQATHARIYNQYGPSEATVGVSLKLLNHTAVITAGAPMPNCRLYVLDEWMNPLPVGVSGNLYIGGMCVGTGYRNQPDLTAQCFLDSPFELGERLYCTGDMACWTAEGEIMIGGRTDQQVKLRGLRVEPEEVSACLSTHPQVKQCTAVVQQRAGQAVLAAYYTSDVPIPEAELLSYAAAYLPHYMVPSAIVRLDQIPLTGNGKVDQGKLPMPDVTGQDENDAPQTDLERTLVGIFAQVLERTDLGADSDYFLCGGNSLNAMETLTLAGKALGCTLRVADLYATRTARRLAALLGDGAETAPTAHSLAPAPQRERYPLSPIQQGIYVQSCMDPTGLAYQMPGAFRISGTPELSRLQRAFDQIIGEELLLRTAFVQEPDGIFARVMPVQPFSLGMISGGSFEEACAGILVPFALDQPPLLRAALWEKDGVWTLLVNLHHMIGDGLTTPVFLRRLDELYQGAPTRKLPLSYLDYACYRLETKGEGNGLKYWTQHLRPLPEPLELPTDFPRGHHFDYRGSTLRFSLGQQMSARCDECCEQWGISPYMLFLSAFGVLMSRLSGQETLMVGAPCAGRLLPETQTMCGPFINTLPLRLAPDPEAALEEYLRGVRDEVNGMLDHQQVGLEEIAAALQLPRSLSQSPLYQVMFSQRPLDADAFTLGGSKLEYCPIPTGTAKMDLVVELAREGEEYVFQAEYAASLFREESIAFWCRCLERLVKSFTAGRNCLLGDLDALSAGDRVALVETPQHTVTPFVNLPVHTMIARQMEMDPDAVALVFHDIPYTRRGLDDMACRIANLLKQEGALPGGRVGIALKRGPELVAAMMAVLKVGCAYVPLLASFPEQRLRYMLETAEISHVLCDDRTRVLLPEGLPCRLVNAHGAASEEFEAAPVKDSDLCNILFTSGSTGKPKGVMLCHRSVSNMFLSIRELLARADGPILGTTNLVFDSFIGETLLPLAMGKAVVLCDEEEMMLPWKVAEIISHHGVEIVQFTPARFQMCLSNDSFCQVAKGLKLILFGGEVLTPLLLKKTAETTDAITVNMYGPTEATVYMTMVDVRPEEPITIGRPLKNGRIYVLDEQCRPVLPTAYGELWLAGEVLSVGYASRPDLTRQAFLPDPFFPGELMYRTGDIARLRLDGCYEFLGRRDAQVKLNGQRVELDEITGAILTSGCALLAATVPVRHDDGSMQLCSFYQPAPEHQGDPEEILRHMRTVLPVYMLPSRIVALEQMPYTPSSKIDLRALGELAASYDSAAAGDQQTFVPEPQPEADAAPCQEPEETLEALLLRLWAQVLGRRELNTHESFFDQGGTSLAALSVLSHYHNYKLILSLQQFYEHPSVMEQVVLLQPEGQNAPSQKQEEGRNAPKEAPQSAGILAPSKKSDLPGEEAHEEYPRYVPELSRPRGGARNVGTVLLTGATGFLGAHVLRELIDAGAARVICLVRGEDDRRLWDTLSWYFGSGWVDGCANLVEVLRGDMTKAGLGLSPADYQRLSGSLNGVWHCAADVRHYAADADAFLATNLAGTQQLIKLARAACVPLCHMSTGSVCGQRLEGSAEPAVFTEKDFCMGQDWNSNLYVKSKFLAEHAVMEAARAGLNARIFRLGRLVGRAGDGTFQKRPETNAFWLTMRGVHALGAIPAGLAQVPVELTPIDWCARAVVALRNAPMLAYHIQNPAPCTMEAAARAVTPGLEILPDEAFEARLEQGLATGRGEILAPLMDFWQRGKTAPATITITNELTMEQLKKAGFHEEIPEPGRMLRAFRFDPAEQRIREEKRE